MRSERPKPLHRLCGRPMLMYVLDALGTLRRSTWPPSSWATRATGSPRRSARRRSASTSSSSSSACSGAPATPRSSAWSACPTTPRTRDVIVLPGDTPLLRAETIGRAGRRSTARTDAAATVLTARMDDPTGYGRIVRGKDDRVVRIVEQGDADRRGAGHRRGQHLGVLLPPVAAGAGAAPHRARQRPGRVLPDRRRRGAGRRPATPSARSWSTTRSRPPGSTTACSWPRPRPSCAVAPTSALLRSGVTMVDPVQHVRRHHRADRPGRHALPRRDPAGRHRHRRRHRDRPEHPPRSTAASARTA